MNDNIKKFISIAVWLTSILLLLRCLISWADIREMWETSQAVNLCYSFFGFIGEAVGISTLIMAVFNKWAWKWKFLSWLHNEPILAKNYEGSLISDYDGVERSGTLSVSQTFLTVSVQLKTKESSSRSQTASIVTVQNVKYLIYTYQNDPRGEIQDRSPIHYGTTMLDVSNPIVLEGNYFTSRKSRGSMKFEAVF